MEVTFALSSLVAGRRGGGKILNPRTARRKEKAFAPVPPEERAETYRIYEKRNGHAGFSSIFSEVDRWSLAGR